MSIDLTEVIAAAHAALDERFYPGPTEEMVRAAIEAAAPLIAAKAWDEGHRFTGYEPGPGENPYRADQIAGAKCDCATCSDCGQCLGPDSRCCGCHDGACCKEADQ